MSSICYNLTKIKAFVFDVDGVLSSGVVVLHPNGEPMRTANIKDGYAIQLAVKYGYKIAIITGGNTEAVRLRYFHLGVQDIYMQSSIKMIDYEKFKTKHGLKDEEILYMGDDIPDIPVMKVAGLSAAPSDAAPEIKEISTYISPYTGGYGCARDVIEQTMKAQGNWMQGEAFGW